MRWLKRIAIGLPLTLLALVVAIYAGSEILIRRTYAEPSTALRAAALDPQENERRARMFGCLDCHGRDGRGQIFFDVKIPPVGRVIAPNLTWVIDDYSDAELARAIRRGVKKDGTSIVIMPSSTFAGLADEDVAAIAAHLRSMSKLPDGTKLTNEFRLLGRVALLTGGIPLEAAVAPEVAPPARRPADLGPYLAGGCLHCHAYATEKPRPDGPGKPAPPLAPMAASYDLPSFTRFMRTGEALGGRELPLMSRIAREAFSSMTDAEIAAMHAFLKSKARTL